MPKQSSVEEVPSDVMPKQSTTERFLEYEVEMSYSEIESQIHKLTFEEEK